MALLWSNTCEGTDDDDVTVLNSDDAGDPISSKTVDANCSFKYNAAAAIHGSTAWLLQTSDTALTRVRAYCSVAASASGALSLYVNLSAIPSTTTRVLTLRNGGSNTISFRILNDGDWTLYDNTGARIYRSVGTFPITQDVRIEFKWENSATTGKMEASIHSGANLESTTPDETIGDMVTNRNTGAAFDEIVWGFDTTVQGVDLVIDEPRVSDTAAYIGPLPPPPPPPSTGWDVGYVGW